MTHNLVALDVGAKRIGVAVADTDLKIVVPYDTIEVDGQEIEAIARVIVDHQADKLVIGYPRNQAGEPTAQTALVEQFADRLRHIDIDIVFEDESLTSVLAEENLRRRGRPYAKADVDKEAAALILESYLGSARAA